MSKYVNKKHGLCIGSDNVFFVIDTAGYDEPPLVLPEGVAEVRDHYRAIVSVRRYYFGKINTVNVFIRTPAEQLLFNEHILTWETPWGVGGEAIMIPRELRYLLPTPWAKRWLETQVGPQYDKWDTYTRGARSSGCIFFKRRTDALAFCNMVDDMLKGMHFGP